MTEAMSLMQWALFFVTIDINLGRWDILPAFIGYYMYVKCLELMKEEYPDILRLKNFCVMLVILNVVYWAVDLNFPLLELIVAVIEIYSTYTLLSVMADYGIQRNMQGAGKLQKYKNILVIFRVILFAFMNELNQFPVLKIPFWAMYMLLLIGIWMCLSDMKHS